MDFKTRRINENKNLHQPTTHHHNHDIDKKSEQQSLKIKKFTLLLSIFIATLLLIFGGLYALVSQIGLKGLVFSFGEELEKDYKNRSNFLLLGTGVQGQNEASTLTDTIMVGSFNHNTKQVTLVSIPRDFYIDSDEFGGSRINQVYEVAKQKYDSDTGIDLLRQKVEEISGLNIHYYAKVNFDGLKQMVDAVGGIEVNVEDSIYDPYYPKDGTIGYEPFRISAGLQKLDGETALKYARSRKTTSDFDRARRQQQVIFAIKEKAVQREILSDPDKITSLFESVNDNLETDLALREIIELAKLGEDLSKDKISSYVLHDDPTQCGGFLYPPPRAQYGGAAVLVPISNGYDYIHKFFEIVLDRTTKNGPEIQVLNGTSTPGLAGEVTMKLSRFCFNVTTAANARNKGIETTNIYHLSTTDEESTAKYATESETISTLVPGQISSIIPPEYLSTDYSASTKIFLELGADFVDSEYRDDFSRYIYQPPAATSDDTDTSDSE